MCIRDRLLPFTRAPLRAALKRRFTVRMGRGFQFVSSSTSMGGSMGGQGESSFGSGAPAGGRVWEAEVIEDDQELPGPEQS